MTRRRVAVTGLGVVASCGVGTDAFWDGLCGPAPDGERRVHDFDPTPHFDNPKEVRRSDRCTQFAIAAADMALEQAGSLTADLPDGVFSSELASVGSKPSRSKSSSGTRRGPDEYPPSWCR